ncbi:TonB C-terminal domain-containing protein [Psychrobacter sp. H7-1]|uniref:TonB C-terminal domain-containing protein n=1 Tax=Psychrobacter sp. H7-1 TaxID=1569265 RepID=UPI00191A7E00|nr:TonB C-terminal domain-containing protein [Psychrobacter sp. H7-1]
MISVLNRAPSVYIPVETEDNGILLPAILSLIVHGSILALIIFLHRIPQLETTPSIETSIVTPEELAAMQAEVRANRDNMMASGVPVTPEFSPQSVPESTHTAELSHESTFSKMSSFFRNEPLPEPVPQSSVSSETELSEPLEAPDITQPDDLTDFAGEQNPLSAQPTSNPPKVKANSQDSGQVAATFASGAEGSSTKSTAASGSATGSSNKASSGDISGALVGMIKPLWNPPVGRVGTRVSVSVTVDANGSVQSVNANTSDEALKQSLESAIRQASPLTPVVGTNTRRIKLNFVVE